MVSIMRWLRNPRTAYTAPQNAPQIKAGIGVVFPFPLPPTSMTFPFPTHNAVSAMPTLSRIYQDQTQPGLSDDDRRPHRISGAQVGRSANFEDRRERRLERRQERRLERRQERRR